MKQQALELATQLTKLIGEMDDTQHTQESEAAYEYMVNHVLPNLRMHNPETPVKSKRAVEWVDGKLVGRTL